MSMWLMSLSSMHSDELNPFAEDIFVFITARCSNTFSIHINGIPTSELMPSINLTVF